MELPVFRNLGMEPNAGSPLLTAFEPDERVPREVPANVPGYRDHLASGWAWALADDVGSITVNFGGPAEGTNTYNPSIVELYGCNLRSTDVSKWIGSVERIGCGTDCTPEGVSNHGCFSFDHLRLNGNGALASSFRSVFDKVPAESSVEECECSGKLTLSDGSSTSDKSKWERCRGPDVSLDLSDTSN